MKAIVWPAWATVSVPLALLAWNPLSPAKLAETALGYEPALMPVRLTPLSVATPLAFVVALPTEFALSVNATDLPETGDPLEVSVAVSVAVPPNVPLPLTALMVVAAAEVTVTIVCPEVDACVVLPE